MLLSLFWGFTVVGGFLFKAELNDRVQFEFEQPDADLFGGTDWVRWEDSAKGIVAVAVHPVVTGNEELRGSHVRVGDVLRKVDYREVFEAETIRELTFRAPPGKVFIYQLERKLPGAFEAETINIFVRSSTLPRLTFNENIGLWRSHTWIAALGGFLSLIAFLILLPILRVKLRENWPVMLVMVVTVLLFLLQFFRQLYYLVDPELSSPEFEQSYLSFFFLVLTMLGPIYMASRWRGWIQYAGFAGIIPAVWLSTKSAFLMRSQQFWLYDEPVIGAILGFFFLPVFLGLVGYAVDEWHSRSTADRSFHMLAGLVTLVLLIAYGGMATGFGEIESEWMLFLALVSVAIPAVSLAAGELKFGKVSVVVSQSILYLLVTATALIMYFLLHQFLSSMAISFKYQVFFELTLLVTAFFLLRNIYRKYSDRFRQYFVLKQQKKVDQLNSFIATIPQHTSSEKLLDDLRENLSDFFETELVEVLMSDEDSDAIEGIGNAELAQLRANLEGAAGNWARNKQLSSVDIDGDLEDKLMSAGVYQAHYIPVKEKYFGFLLLGKKKRGVYNLSDVETISRIIQQTRLTLDVLDLLEREKSLIQKNYEANLTALRSQINPHFLFNTLNTISSLIHDSPDDAEVAIEKLAFIFRYTLNKSAEDFVSIRDEMSLVSTYLDIEQIRFGARLEVHYEVDDKALDTPMPAFAIQTIVENCIKHGIAKIIEKGVIRINISFGSDQTICEIEDNGPGIDLSRINASTGLNNILTRLEKIYGDRNLLYFENTGNGTLVRLKIPNQNEQKTESSDS